MSLDLDLIVFTDGERKGQIGCCMDRKLQVFVLYDKDGVAVYSWTDADVYGDSPVIEGIPRFELYPVSSVTICELKLLLTVAAELRESTGQAVYCLVDNIGKEVRRQMEPKPDPAAVTCGWDNLI